MAGRIELPLNKFENPLQLGGIRTGTIDSPGIGGRPVRVAHFDTGGGLRFTLALDRGGDIIDAFHHRHSLTYLSPVGLLPPNHAYHAGSDWLNAWAGGLLTTCGPVNIGWPREVDGIKTSLHGHHSNTPAAVNALNNPDPRRGQLDMAIDMTVTDARTFGPIVEVKRSVSCTLGVNEIRFHDVVTNLGDTRSPHHWLYHVNFGYPLLDRGARLIYRGYSEYWEGATGDASKPSDAELNRIKTVTDPLPHHKGGGEHGLVVQVTPDRKGLCHTGILNKKLGLAVEVEFPAKQLPRIANWQHFGPRGSYVTGIEPFSGSLMGPAKDKFPGANQFLEPGESRGYELTLRVHTDAAAIKAFAAHDGEVWG